MDYRLEKTSNAYNDSWRVITQDEVVVGTINRQTRGEKTTSWYYHASERYPDGTWSCHGDESSRKRAAERLVRHHEGVLEVKAKNEQELPYHLDNMKDQVEAAVDSDFANALFAATTPQALVSTLEAAMGELEVVLAAARRLAQLHPAR